MQIKSGYVNIQSKKKKQHLTKFQQANHNSDKKCKVRKTQGKLLSIHIKVKWRIKYTKKTPKVSKKKGFKRPPKTNYSKNTAKDKR